MAASKSSAKSASTKRTAPATALAAGKPRLSAKAKAAVKAEPLKKAVGKLEATPKTAAKTVAKAAPKATPRPRAKKTGDAAFRPPSVVPAEQRRHYIEMAAYYIAERRGFAAGDPLVDWVQAEAEIDRLLAAGLLGA